MRLCLPVLFLLIGILLSPCTASDEPADGTVVPADAGGGVAGIAEAARGGPPLPPRADFAVYGPTTGPAPFRVQFFDNTSGTPPFRHRWDFGDGGASTEMNPVHVYTQNGVYTVTLAVEGPYGSDSVAKEGYIRVMNATPAANFTASPAFGPAPLEVTFTDTSAGVVHERFWEFGDGTTAWSNESATVTHVYTLPGNYTVSLTVRNEGGEDRLARPGCVTVLPSGPPPIPYFVANPPFGFAPLTVRFRDMSVRSPTAWFWDFGDGVTSTERNPVHTYALPGIYTVALTVGNAGGTATSTGTVVVRSPTTVPTPATTVTTPPTTPVPPAKPPVAFFRMNVTIGKAPLSVRFTDMSFFAPASWHWDFGDGNTSSERNPVHTYVSPGTYTVTLTVRNAAGESTTSRPVFAR
ncbi:MAG: PKD domain-containing protein [Methanolinea sp.]|nr:PKD domain-containing protein [Methanolinea sp.]